MACVTDTLHPNLREPVPLWWFVRTGKISTLALQFGNSPLDGMPISRLAIPKPHSDPTVQSLVSVLVHKRI